MSRRRRRRWLGRLAVLALLLAPIVAAAQAPEAPPAEAPAAAEQPGAGPAPTVVFPDRIDVAVVNLQVWVTDDDGDPVVALQPEDFELRVDGEPMAISHFSEIRAARAIPSGPAARAAAGPGAPPEAVDQLAPEAFAAPAPLEEESLILYFDELHLGRLQRKAAIEDLRELIAARRVQPERMMILHQTGRLISAASFGSTAEQLDAVLEQLSDPPAGIAAPDEKRRLIGRIWDRWEESRQRAPLAIDPCQFFVRPTLDEVDAYAREAANRSLYSLEQLADVADFLGGVPGVKTVIYLGDALELTPGTDLLEIVHGLCPAELPGAPSPVATEDLTTRFERLAAAANAGRVTIHTMQVGGLSPGLIGNPEQRSSDPLLAGRFERALRTNERSGLEVIAVRTGGRAIRDTNRFDVPLEEIARDLQSYYSIGFSPGEGFSVGMHRIEVKTRHRGLRVRHRREFHLKSPSERLDELVLRAIYLGVAPEAFDLRLAHGEIRSAQGDRFLLPIHVLVPVDRIAYRAGADGPPMASLEVAVHGRSPDQPEGPAVRRIFRFAEPAEKKGRAELVVEIPLRPGLHVIGVGVRDQVSGEVAAVATTLGVHPPPPGEVGGSG